MARGSALLSSDSDKKTIGSTSGASHSVLPMNSPSSVMLSTKTGICSNEDVQGMFKSCKCHCYQLSMLANQLRPALKLICIDSVIGAHAFVPSCHMMWQSILVLALHQPLASMSGGLLLTALLAIVFQAFFVPYRHVHVHQQWTIPHDMNTQNQDFIPGGQSGTLQNPDPHVVARRLAHLFSLLAHLEAPASTIHSAKISVT